MPMINVRVTEQEKRKVRRLAKQSGKSVSDYVRSLLKTKFINVEDRWKIILWNIFGINLVKINSAIRRSSSVEEFFSYVDNHLKDRKKYKILPKVTKEISIDFTIGDNVFIIDEKRHHDIVTSIKHIVYKLDNKITEDYEGRRK